MSLSEFSFIEHYLKQKNEDPNIILDIGDDAAIVEFPPGEQVVIATDTLVENVHFRSDWSPAQIAYKALAVNISDFAAMAVKPKYVLLALTIPHLDKTWVENFCHEFFALLSQYQLKLIGGDTTRGPLTITLQLVGSVEPHKALTRKGARPGDLIYVTGELGAAAYAVKLMEQSGSSFPPDAEDILIDLLHPIPRLDEALALRDYVSSAIDISDGLAGDLQHILECSQVGATLYLEKIPVAKALLKRLTLSEAQRMALTGGDDYELCFTVPPQHQSTVDKILKQFSCGGIQIGVIESQAGLRCKKEDGSELLLDKLGFTHFQ